MAVFKELEWLDPLALAAAVKDEVFVLLYSGVQASYSGRYSYLACNLSKRIDSSDFAELSAALSSNKDVFENAWFGYLGYGLKDTLEELVHDASGWLELPRLCMMQFDTIYQFDHEQRRLTLHAKNATHLIHAEPLAPLPHAPAISNLASNMSRQEYLQKAAHVIECIRRGDLYQANLTRKFMGEFTKTPNGFDLFRRLCAVSPAPYSAYIKLGGTHIISSSPELFLNISKDGQVRTRPIKGTAARFDDSAQDMASRSALAASDKDRAENLMIVDLMRNDLSRSCALTSVKTEALFEVTTHATIHHMSSTITGAKRDTCSTLDVIRHAFPPGSMTGAPKIRAMNLCSELERQERGIYSGAIGWFGGDGGCELSVVIRTLIVQGRRFEFQVGGGIVADSTPESEFEEIIEKSKGIISLLGISAQQLRDIDMQ